MRAQTNSVGQFPGGAFRRHADLGGGAWMCLAASITSMMASGDQERTPQIIPRWPIRGE